METSYHDGQWGRVRSRAVGRARGRLPEVALVQGMAVADYLLPGLASLGEWTRAHLVELPGLSGSGEPPHELDMSEYGRCVAEWLEKRAASVPSGEYVEVPGAHTFPWLDPHAWSDPVRRFANRVSAAPRWAEGR